MIHADQTEMRVFVMNVRIENGARPADGAIGHQYWDAADRILNLVMIANDFYWVGFRLPLQFSGNHQRIRINPIVYHGNHQFILRLIKHLISEELKIECVSDEQVGNDCHGKQYFFPDFSLPQDVSQWIQNHQYCNEANPNDVSVDEVSKVDGVGFLAAREGHDKINSKNFSSEEQKKPKQQ